MILDDGNTNIIVGEWNEEWAWYRNRFTSEKH